MAHTYEYAVLRLEPNPLRAEAVNIGIVVFHRDHVDVRCGRVLTRAKAILPGFDQSLVEEISHTVGRLGKSELPAPQRHAAMSRIGVASLSDLRFFNLDDDSQDEYDKQVHEIMHLFVGEKRSSRATAKHRTLIADVRDEFRKSDVLAAVGDAAAITQHKIVPEWPIPQRPSLKADLALLNGQLRVCEVADFNFSEGNSIPSSFYAGLITLEQAADTANARKRVFAYRAEGDRKLIDEVLAIASDNATDLVDLGVMKQRRDFVDEWIAAAESR